MGVSLLLIFYPVPERIEITVNFYELGAKIQSEYSFDEQRCIMHLLPIGQSLIPLCTSAGLQSRFIIARFLSTERCFGRQVLTKFHCNCSERCECAFDHRHTPHHLRILHDYRRLKVRIEHLSQLLARRSQLLR